MTFWFSEYKNYFNIPNNFLCVAISKNIPHYFNKKNAVIPYKGIFNIPNILITQDFESTYYNYVDSAIRKMGWNGFNAYLISMNEMYSNTFFHDDNDKQIKYSNIVFMFDETEDNRHLPLIEKLFSNFGNSIKQFSNKTFDKSLF